MYRETSANFNICPLFSIGTSSPSSANLADPFKIGVLNHLEPQLLYVIKATKLSISTNSIVAPHSSTIIRFIVRIDSDNCQQVPYLDVIVEVFTAYLWHRNASAAEIPI